MQLIHEAGITHVSYILIIYSFATMLFLLTNVLIRLHSATVKPVALAKDDRRPARNVHIHGHRPTESAQIRDAQEFELEGLISDEELDTPTTLGKNEHDRAD